MDLYNAAWIIPVKNSVYFRDNYEYYDFKKAKNAFLFLLIDTGTHIDRIINCPELFGLTYKYIKSEYKKYDEPLYHEGKARSVIMQKCIDNGFVRLRFNEKNYVYTAELNESTSDYMSLLTFFSILTNKSIMSDFYSENNSTFYEINAFTLLKIFARKMESYENDNDLLWDNIKNYKFNFDFRIIEHRTKNVMRKSAKEIVLKTIKQILFNKDNEFQNHYILNEKLLKGRQNV